MESAHSQLVLAFLCNQHGTIKSVLRDDFNVGIAEGQLWIGLADHASVIHALSFINEVIEKGAVYDWQIGVRVKDEIVTMHCAGGKIEDMLLIVATSPPAADRYYEEELDKILGEYSNLVRSQLPKLADNEDTYIEEVSRLNSELINIQRELSKRNTELAEKTRFIERIFEAVPNLLMVFDLRANRLVFANREIILSLGYTSAEIQRMGPTFLRQLLHPSDAAVFEEHNRRLLSLPDKETLEVEYRLRDARGEWRWISSRDTVFTRGEDGSPVQILSAAQDITERKKVQEKLWYLSTHDSLTGLYNRGYFYEEMGRIERSRSSPISILLVDLDDLKKTNDTLGHTAGDDLLRRAAAILRSCFRPAEVIARVGGDEFAVLLERTGPATARGIIERVQRAVEAESLARPDEPRLGMSAGIAVAEGPMPLLEIYKQADSQMYADKVMRKQTGNLRG